MRRDALILVATLAAGGAWMGAPRVLDAAGSLEAFRVVDVEIRGLRNVSRSEVLERMGITGSSSIWGNPERWAAAVREHPLVRDARVERRLPGTLLVSVEEREPVALVPTPVLEAVDRDGVRLDLDPAGSTMDLPVLDVEAPPARGTRLMPEAARRLAAEVARVVAGDTAFLRMVSEATWTAGGDLALRWIEPEVTFLLRPGTPPRVLREGLVVLSDAVGRDLDHPPTEIDLRFADRVVVRRTR